MTFRIFKLQKFIIFFRYISLNSPLGEQGVCVFTAPFCVLSHDGFSDWSRSEKPPLRRVGACHLFQLVGTQHPPHLFLRTLLFCCLAFKHILHPGFFPYVHSVTAQNRVPVQESWRIGRYATSFRVDRTSKFAVNLISNFAPFWELLTASLPDMSSIIP